MPSAKANAVHNNASTTSKQRRDMFIGVFLVFYHKVVGGQHAPRRHESGTEVSDLNKPGQAHNDAKLEEIMRACKLLRIFGNRRVNCVNDCTSPKLPPPTGSFELGTFFPRSARCNGFCINSHPSPARVLLCSS